ncbi:hypothetical protein [Sphingobacterium pedocola]|uniref:Uncharacterized protein n=1 Tax=Sphingobacterium pedocola TaxID=2082722 RepID=A0ABR9T488_9SPHI|nr:hypothetical protein [Sphingobacterium pedocola]MBE8720165.1 hypothetical protein [Sphingobacterium pedocola]
MKNTQKKLKAKHFRYLSKEYVKDPLQYIRFFYDQYELRHWQEKVYVFLTSGSAQFRPPLFDPYYVHQNIIKHIEIAYIMNERVVGGGIASRFLNYFFEINCREYWLETMYELLKNETDCNYRHDEDNYNLYIIRTIELLHYLSYYFYLLSIDKAEDFNIPIYVLPYHNLTDKEREHKNCLQRLPDDDDVIRKSPVPFFHREQVALPEWLAPQAYSLTAIRDFFQVSSLEGWKNDLWNWYQAVLTEGQFWSADKKMLSGANLLYSYACFYSLLEMYRSQAAPEQQTPNFSCKKSRSVFKVYPNVTIEHKDSTISLQYVLQDDTENPLGAITDLVTEYNKFEWDEILYDWLFYGLSSGEIGGTKYAEHTSYIYQSLVKIVELSYVLAFKHEIEFTNQHKN